MCAYVLIIFSLSFYFFNFFNFFFFFFFFVSFLSFLWFVVLMEAMEKTGSEKLLFAFQWILILLKREFLYDDIPTLWDVGYYSHKNILVNNNNSIPRE